MAADYYAILGVDPSATTEEIKKAFRRIARETHPDTNPGDAAAEATFREAAEAYEVLSDPERRARYDRGDTIDLSDLFTGVGGLDDLLRSVFGDGGLFGGSAARAARGRDILVRTEVTLETAAFGGEAEVEFNTRISCSQCGGNGSEPGAEIMTCPDCGGAGQVRVSRRSLFGTMMSVTTCPRCAGEGRLITNPCPRCSGDGSVSEHARVSVEIPAGVSSGTRLRLSGRGESVGRKGPPGDLFVEIQVSGDPRFERRDNDLVHRVELGISEAALGTRIEIPLIEGGVMPLEVPAGTQPGKVFRIGGKGMTALGRRTRGDLLVVVELVVPTELTSEEEGLLRRWSELRGERTDRPASA
jgi:molecular chaperone DnaJ